MPSGRETILVEQTDPRLRLDIFLRRHYPPVSRGTFQRLIEEGQIRIDGKPVKPTHTPRAGETIEIHWPEPKPALAQPKEMPLEILFEDADMLVLNKPAGLVVHPAAGHEDDTLVNALLHHCQGSLSGIGGVLRPGIVHRLDKETSGCLVVAKNDESHLALSRQFAGRSIRKIYLAIVCGKPNPPEGEIRAGIARHPTHRKRMAVAKGGRDAWTSYRTLEPFGPATLVEATLHTGRTHQVRVHFQSIGHPLVGDSTYGKRQNLRITEETGFMASRQMLHAFRLSLDHPRSGKRLDFEAPLPEDFEACLRHFRLGRAP